MKRRRQSLGKWEIVSSVLLSFGNAEASQVSFGNIYAPKKYISSELIHAVCPIRKDNFLMGYSARTLRNIYQKVFREAAKKNYCNTLVC